MADFYTHFSCLLDVGSPDNAARALDLYQAFMEDAAREEVPSEGFLLSVQPDLGATKLWIHDDATGDPQQAIDFVLRCAEAFALTGRWGFQWANTCSRPRIDAFGGGAHVLDLEKRTTIAWADTRRCCAPRKTTISRLWNEPTPRLERRDTSFVRSAATAPIMCSRHLGISPTGTPMTPISRRPRPTCHPNRQPDPLSRLDLSGRGVSRVNGRAVPASPGWRCVTHETLPRPVASLPRRADQEMTSDVQGSQQA